MASGAAAPAHLQQHHPQARWNTDVFHFSDGDHWDDDNARCRELVTQLLAHTTMVGYGEIRYRDEASFYGWVKSYNPAWSTLHKELSTVDELDLFAYGYACEHGPQGEKRCQKCGEIAIQSRKREDIVYSLVAPRFNYGAPKITVAHVNADGSLLLGHERTDLGPLDLTYAEKTLAYLHELWKQPVHVRTFNSRNQAATLTYSAAGIEVGR